VWTSFALLFGTTWLVNAPRVRGRAGGRACSRSKVTRRFPTPPIPAMYALLVGGLAFELAGADIVAAIGWRSWCEWSSRWVIAFLPIFAGEHHLCETVSPRTGDAALSFSTNLLGAMLGGLPGSIYRSCSVITPLLILAAVLYVGAYLISPTSAHRLHRPSNAL